MLHILAVALLTQPPAAAKQPRRKPDACALLADADVRAVLGATVKERRPGAHAARGLLLSQCYLETGTPRSISIAVAGSTSARGNTITPPAFWRDQFRRSDEHAADRAAGTRQAAPPATAEREAEAEARPIEGIGEEAFWSGTGVAGALYVLRGDTFIRVSVGGISDERERIEKSRQLAAAALARLK
jgi:hypothetical protein